MDYKKKQVIKISILITSIFIIFLSITYAFINQTVFGTKRQVITAEDLEVKLEEGEELTINDAMPMYDEVGKIQKQSFNFKLKNNSNYTLDYILYLKDITSNEKEKLFYEDVRYYLTKDGQDLKLENLSAREDDIIDKGRIKKNNIIDYSLRLWINSSVTEEDAIKGKTLSLKLVVKAVAITEYEISKEEVKGGDVSVVTLSEPEKEVEFVTTPNSGFTYYGAKILNSEGITITTLSSSQKSFTMPNEDVIIRPMWKKDDFFVLRADKPAATGWTIRNHAGGPPQQITYFANRNYLYHLPSDASTRYDFVSNSSFDVTDYSTIQAGGSAYTGISCTPYHILSVSLVTNFTTWVNGGISVASATVRSTGSFSMSSNISNITGKYYVGAQFWSQGSCAASEITSIRLVGKVYQ